MHETLPTEVQQLLDKDAIEELVYEWDYLTDERADTADVIETYCTDDVIYDAGPLGSAEGKAAFIEVAEGLWDEEVMFTRHMRSNPVIDVDGDDATGKWYAEIPSITADGDAIWVQGTYEIDFRRVEGDWKISKYTFDFAYATPYDEGWVAQPFVEGIPGALDW